MTDRTLPHNTTVTINGSVFNITGGTQAGRNLFHSFQQFSVPTRGTASFNNGLDVQNIFTRVTGGSVSNIDGVIKANGTANLFFLNPNGIVFGKNASLNVGGSFVATTANAIQFGNQGTFSASVPNNPALLTVNPTALFYNQIATAPIQNNSTAPAGVDPAGSNVSGLRVEDRKSLLLVGGNVNINGGQLNAYGGRVELGGLAVPGTVGIEVNGNDLSLGFPASSTRADISLTNGASVNVEASGGGNIAINTRNLDVLGGSILRAGIIGQGLGAVNSQAGDIDIDAKQTVTLAGSGIFNVVYPRSVGNGGNINITAGSLSGTNGAYVATTTYGKGVAGNMTIQSSGAVSFDGVDSKGNSTVFSNVELGAVGKGGNIDITAGSLSLTNSGQVATATYGKGIAGNITIRTSGAVSIDGGSSLVSDGNITNIASAVDSQVQGEGKGGEINITAESLFLTNGGQIGVSTFGRGDAGNVRVQVSGPVSFSGLVSKYGDTGVFSNVMRSAVGKGGNIDITAGSLSVTNGAGLVADTFGQGDAGSVRIHATNAVSFDGANDKFYSGAYSNVQSTGVGKGGEIDITAESLSVTNGAQLGGGTFGQGDGGSVNIQTNNLVSFDGADRNGAKSRAFSGVGSGSVGKGGDITITTGLLRITNGAELSAKSEVSNNAAGNIKVTARSIRLDNESTISADTQGDKGNINLYFRDLIMRRGSEITTNAEGINITGGNITINAKNGFIIAVPQEDSRISANSQDFRGGNVKINTAGIFGIETTNAPPPLSDITATG